MPRACCDCRITIQRSTLSRPGEETPERVPCPDPWSSRLGLLTGTQQQSQEQVAGSRQRRRTQQGKRATQWDAPLHEKVTPAADLLNTQGFHHVPMSRDTTAGARPAAAQHPPDAEILACPRKISGHDPPLPRLSVNYLIAPSVQTHPTKEGATQRGAPHIRVVGTCK